MSAGSAFDGGAFKAPDPAFAERVRGIFDAQALMRTLGATLLRVAPGDVEIGFDFNADFTQQNGFLHAGVTATLVDTACGMAATTLMPAGADVLSVEFKVNLLRPADGARFVASGRVIKPGYTLMVTHGDLWAFPLATSTDSDRVHVATMQATMIRR
ncbi:MAG: PaaI family thioesterase [Pseudomonadota bacterium]